MYVLSSLVWSITYNKKAVFSQKRRGVSAEGSAEGSVYCALVAEHVLGEKGGGFGVISTTTNGQFAVFWGGVGFSGGVANGERGVAPE